MRFSYVCIAASLACVLNAGCSQRAWWTPPEDPALRKKTHEFKADAAKRHPYKADAPRGGEADGRAEVGYTLNQISLVNFSNQEWTDVEIWVNKAYVVHVPKIEPGKLKRINFQMLFNNQGKNFPLDNRKTLVETVEVFHGGKMYVVPVKLGD
jgi:hypothetical protein